MQVRKPNFEHLRVRFENWLSTTNSYDESLLVLFIFVPIRLKISFRKWAFYFPRTLVFKRLVTNNTFKLDKSHNYFEYLLVPSIITC